MKASDAVQSTTDRSQTPASNATAKSATTGFSDALMQLLSVANQNTDLKTMPEGTAANSSGTADVAQLLASSTTDNIAVAPAGLDQEPDAPLHGEALVAANQVVTTAQLTGPKAKLQTIGPENGKLVASNANNLLAGQDELPDATMTATATATAEGTISQAAAVPTPIMGSEPSVTAPFVSAQMPRTENPTEFVPSTLIHGRAPIRAISGQQGTAQIANSSVRVNTDLDNKTAAATQPSTIEPSPLTHAPLTQILPGIGAVLRKTSATDSSVVNKQAPDIGSYQEDSNNGIAAKPGTQGTAAAVEQVLVEKATAENNKQISDAQMMKISQAENPEQSPMANRRSQAFVPAFTSNTDSLAQSMAADTAKAGLLTPTSPMDLKTSDSASLATRPMAPLPNQTPQTASPTIMAAAGRNVQWMLDQGISKATMQLHPAELGALRINIEVQDEQLTIQLTASQAGTRDALELSIPRLREQLADQGFQDIQIDLGNHGAEDQQEKAQSQTDSTETLTPMSEPDATNPTHNTQQTLNVEQGLVDMFA